MLKLLLISYGGKCLHAVLMLNHNQQARDNIDIVFKFKSIKAVQHLADQLNTPHNHFCENVSMRNDHTSFSKSERELYLCMCWINVITLNLFVIKKLWQLPLFFQTPSTTEVT